MIEGSLSACRVNRGRKVESKKWKKYRYHKKDQLITLGSPLAQFSIKSWRTVFHPDPVNENLHGKFCCVPNALDGIDFSAHALRLEFYPIQDPRSKIQDSKTYEQRTFQIEMNLRWLPCERDNVQKSHWRQDLNGNMATKIFYRRPLPKPSQGSKSDSSQSPTWLSYVCKEPVRFCPGVL